MTTLDRRLNVCRPDRADIRLRDQVEAKLFVEGRPSRVAVPVADIRSQPSADAALDSQLLLGDAVHVFENHDGWSWVQSDRDSYVGYTPSSGLGGDAAQSTHHVIAPRTFVYRDADLKTPAIETLPMGCGVNCTSEAETRGTAYRFLASGGAVIASHVAPSAAMASGDYVSIAEQLINTPYLWGGTSALGIDCSGLVQLSMHMKGQNVLRDTDMQAASIGSEIDPGDGFNGLRRGDLVFWKGHVAIMLDEKTIIHASGHRMLVCTEPLKEAIERIGYLYGLPTVCRRP